MKYDRLSLGYHGCKAKDAEAILATGEFKPSENDYDWLGRGIYFWEYGPDRAQRFVDEKLNQVGSTDAATVVGAVIQLGVCFDLLDTANTEQLTDAYPDFERAMANAGTELPANTGTAPEHKLRRLDCAVLNWYLQLPGQRHYQSVRACFLEGGSAFPNSQLRAEAHIQIAVRDPTCIVGTFQPH